MQTRVMIVDPGDELRSLAVIALDHARFFAIVASGVVGAVHALARVGPVDVVLCASSSARRDMPRLLSRAKGAIVAVATAGGLAEPVTPGIVLVARPNTAEELRELIEQLASRRERREIPRADGPQVSLRLLTPTGRNSSGTRRAVRTAKAWTPRPSLPRS